MWPFKALLVTWLVTSCDVIRAQDGQVPDVSSDPTVFTSTELPGNMRYMCSVANGHLASNIYSDTIYMDGLYSGVGGRSHRARVPAVHSSNITMATTTSQQFSLDTNTGLYQQTLLTPDVTVTYRVYAHRFYNRLLITEVVMNRLGPVGYAITATRTPLTTNMDSDDLILNATQPYSEVTSGCGQTPNITCKRRDGTIREPETQTSGYTPVSMYWNDIPTDFTLGPDDVTRTWSYVISVDTNDATAMDNFNIGMNFVQNQNAGELLSNHTGEWANVWSRGSIDIEGDTSVLTLRKVVRGALYYLHSFLPSARSYSGESQFYGLSPGGLANGAQGTDYYGHVFWDMETWMYPAMLLLRPDLARHMLNYRINGMDPAFQRAADGGYNGTRFPWESGYSGAEVTPFICIPCRENQIHITSDIAYAARQYISATRDVTWLTETQAGTPYTGADFLLEMARFWASRPTYNATKDKYEINGVMPPDEHQSECNNSVYTNVGASLAVHFARYSSCLAGRDALGDVPDSWLNIVQQLFFPFNQQRRYHEEYEGYEQDVQNNETHESFVKQADVVLLGYPFLWDMPDDVRENDLLEYENVTSPGGPAMTWGMFAVGWLDMDNDAKAASLFERSYQLYYREPFKVWTEAQQGAGAINFVTGMGGFLQAIVSGYAGLRLNVEHLGFRQPKLPPGVTTISINNINYLGNQLNYQVTSTDISMTAVTTGSMPLVLYLQDGTPLNLEQGVVNNFPLQSFSVNTTVSTGCPLPLDYIEVDYSTPVVTKPPCTHVRTCVQPGQNPPPSIFST